MGAGSSGLLEALEAKDPSKLRKLTSKGSLGDLQDVRRMSSQCMCGNTGSNIQQCSHSVLHRAAYNGHDFAIRAFVESGLDIDLRSETGATALHIAAHRGNAACAKALLENRADPNAQDQELDTPLHKAMRVGHLSMTGERGHLEVIKVLLAYGARPDARNAAEETPAETQHYSNELIKLFNDAQIANEDNVELPSYAPMPEKQQEKHKNEAAGVVYEKLEGGPDAHKQRSSIPIYEATPGRE